MIDNKMKYDRGRELTGLINMFQTWTMCSQFLYQRLKRPEQASPKPAPGLSDRNPARPYLNRRS